MKQEHTFTVGAEYITVAPGHLVSNLKSDEPEDVEYNAAIDGLESLLLAMATAGLPMDKPEMQEAVEIAVEAIANYHC